MSHSNAAAGRLKGKIAIVTGGAQGIGKEIARVFIREGAYVLIADINDDVGLAAARELGSATEYVHLDVSQKDSWKSCMQDLIDRHSKLDILVNNAGLNIPVDPENGTFEDWKKVQAVDLDGVFLGCKYGIKAMKNACNGGSIINISSIASTRGMPYGCAYAASKTAVTNLSKSVAVYCGQQGYNIRCNWVSPGFIPTPMLNSSIKGNSDTEKVMANYISSTPLGKIGSEEDIANGVLYLASDESCYVTGTELRIDGGVTVWTGMPWKRDSHQSP